MNDDHDIDQDQRITPADEPLDEQARARLRERVVEGLRAEQEPPPRRRRWAVPAGAAAAVVLVVGAAGLLAHALDGSHTSQDGDALGAPTTDPVTVRPSSASPASPAADQPQQAVTACRHETDLRDAHVSAVQPGAAGGDLVFLANDQQWQLCSTHPDAAQPGGRVVTLHSAQPLDPSSAGGAEAYQVSNDALAQNGTPQSDGLTPGDTVTQGVHVSKQPLGSGDVDYVQEFAAGGPLPKGDDTDIVYTFPGGRQETASVLDGSDGHTWWAMDYVATDGPLARPGVNQTRLDPITVRVTPAGGPPRSYTLQWGLDTCAQINHGC